MIGPAASPVGLVTPSAPPLSLIRVPGVLATPTEMSGNRWMAGITGDPEFCNIDLDVTTTDGDFPYWWECPGEGGTAASSALDDGGLDGTKLLADKPDEVSVQAFTIWAGEKCSAMDLHSEPRVAEVEARVLRKLNALTPAAIERELWTGQIAALAGFSNPALMDSGSLEELNSGTATPFVNALAELEQGFADFGNLVGRRIIHAQPRVVSVWRSYDLVEPSPDRSYMTTATGTYVVPGVGYPGTPTDGSAPTLEESYAFGTGMVRVFLSQPGPISRFEQGIDRTDNSVEVRAERQALIYWEPCLHLGIDVDLCNPFCSTAP